MIWSYRVVRHLNHKNEVVYSIREAMYGKDRDDCEGMPIEQAEKMGISITQEAIAAETSFTQGELDPDVERADAIEELRDQLLGMLEALDMPIVEATTVYSESVISASTKLRDFLDGLRPNSVISVGITCQGDGSNALMVYYDKSAHLSVPDLFDGYKVIGRPINPPSPA